MDVGGIEGRKERDAARELGSIPLSSLVLLIGWAKEITTFHNSRDMASVWA